MSDRPVLLAAGAAWAALVFTAAVPLHAPDPYWIAGSVWPGAAGWTMAGVGGAAVRAARAMLGLALVLAAIRGAGGRAGGWLRTSRPDAVRWAAGLVLVGLGAAGLAFTGLGAGWIVIGCTAGMIRRPRRDDLRRTWRTVRHDAREAGWLPVAAAVALAAAAALHAMAPELTTDALRAGLGTPRDALAIGRLVPDAASPFAWYPLVPTGLGLALLPAGGEAAVRLGHTLAWVATAVSLWRWVRPAAGPALASLAAALWLGGLNALVVASCAWTDHLLAWLVLGAARRQLAGGGPRVVGLWWGAAAAVKLQAAWPAAGAVAACALLRGPGGALRLGLWMLPPVLPWLLRNALQAGHPAAPFGMAWGPDAVPVFAPPYPPVAAWESVRDLPRVLAAPFHCATGLGVWDGLLSPALVVVLPLAVLASRPRGLRTVVAIALAGWGWSAGYGGRYLLPVAPLILGAAASGAARLAGRAGVPAPIRLAGWAAAGFEAAASLALAFRLFHPAAAAWGVESPAAYLRRQSDPRPVAWDAGRALAASVGPRDRYLLVGSLRLPGWPGRPRADEEGLPPRAAVLAARSAESRRLAIALRQEGLAWVVLRVRPPATDLGLVPDPSTWTPRRRATWAGLLAHRTRVAAVQEEAGARFEIRRVVHR